MKRNQVYRHNQLPNIQLILMAPASSVSKTETMALCRLSVEGWHITDAMIHEKDIAAEWHLEFDPPSPAGASAKEGQPP